MNREKMSKSTGNVVNPFFAIERFGVDGMRFFLAYRGGLADDADFDNSFIIRDYKKLLQGGIGNLALRTIGCARGNLRSYIMDARSNKLPAATPEDLDHQKMLEQTPPKVAEFMENLNPRAALQETMSIIEKVRGDPRTGSASIDLFFSRLTSTSMRRSRGKLPTLERSTTWRNRCGSLAFYCNRSCPASLMIF
jgi:leucyl-tRNA synthetase